MSHRREVDNGPFIGTLRFVLNICFNFSKLISFLWIFEGALQTMGFYVRTVFSAEYSAANHATQRPLHVSPLWC